VILSFSDIMRQIGSYRAFYCGEGLLVIIEGRNLLEADSNVKGEMRDPSANVE